MFISTALPGQEFQVYRKQKITMAKSRTLTYFLICIGVTFLIQSCSEKSDPVFDEGNFTSIFDNNQFSVSVFPIDVKQTSDGGYIVLGERRLQNSNFRGIYLMKADKYGKFVNGVELDEQYVNPIPDLMPSGNALYFFCMDGLNLQSRLARVSTDTDTVGATVIPVTGELTYPSAAALDDNNFLLLSYDHSDKLTVVSQINTSGSIIGQSAGFDIGAGDDVEEPIINHFIRTGKRFPFQIGKVGNGSYFFNGFQNYTFSLIFTNMTSITGVVQGQQDDGGMSAIYPLGGNKFAAARFNFGDNYFLPNINLSNNGLAISVDLGGNTLPELVGNAPVKILKAQISNKNVLVFASDTKSKQIGLYFYDELTGEFLSSRYLGFSNPFEVANVIQTADKGLLVCGTTYLAGRFPRICLIKLSGDELNGQLK
jgi:hypothetical protein